MLLGSISGLGIDVALMTWVISGPGTDDSDGLLTSWLLRALLPQGSSSPSLPSPTLRVTEAAVRPGCQPGCQCVRVDLAGQNTVTTISAVTYMTRHNWQQH